MATRILRNRPSQATGRITDLMKSISENQDTIAAASAKVKVELAELLILMQASKRDTYSVDAITAEVYRPSGKTTNTVDVAAFRKLVKDDKEFYSAVSVSVTKAKEILPKKLYDSIVTSTPPVAGEPAVRVRHG